jgi:hypothetical protein
MCSTTDTAELAVPSATKAVGDPCTPSDEHRADFSGFDAYEVVVENGAPECESNVCLVNHFQGRTDCPYGQPEPPAAAPVAACDVFGSAAPVTVAVRPQVAKRPPDSAVYCSCRCDGPGPGPFCQCPGGFECTPLVADQNLLSVQDVAGSYCVKSGTAVQDPSALTTEQQCGIVGPRPSGCGDP